VTAVFGDFVLDGFTEGTPVTVRDAKTGADRHSAQGSLTGAGPGWFVATGDERLWFHSLP
jgi:hypothetical protein